MPRDSVRKAHWYAVCGLPGMVITLIALVWVGLALAFVLALGLAARRPMPKAQAEEYALDEAA